MEPKTRLDILSDRGERYLRIATPEIKPRTKPPIAYQAHMLSNPCSPTARPSTDTAATRQTTASASEKKILKAIFEDLMTINKICALNIGNRSYFSTLKKDRN
jgi:hypothetical protein